MKELSPLEEKLQSMTADQFIKYDLNGETLIGKVLRVYDPDTLTIGVCISDRFVKINVRLSGIDSPELKSKANNGLESKLCRLGRNWVRKEYQDELVIVECKEMDKYGRLLGIVRPKSDPSLSINDLLVSYKFCRIYGGDLHKKEWSICELEEGIKCADSIGISDE